MAEESLWGRGAQAVVMYGYKQMEMFGAELGALFRQGLKDARTLVMGEWGKGVEEPGTLGNLTSQQVTATFEPDKQPGVQAPEPPTPEAQIAQAEARAADRGQEREFGD